MDEAEVKTNEAVQEQEEQTFSKAELNAIIQRRIDKVRAEYGNYEELKEKALKFDEIEEQSKTELQKVTERADALQKELDGMKKADTVRQIRESVAKETGVPAHLLHGETKEECEEMAKAIMSYAKPNAYPTVKDGGEVRNIGGGKTRDQFADWLNSLGGQ